VSWLVCFLLAGCGSAGNTGVNQIKQLVGDSEAFYKGGYGTIVRDLYVRRSDASNNIYSATNLVFRGNSNSVEELVYLDEPSSNPVRVDVKTFQMPNKGVVVLFCRDFVYVADMTAREYFKYRREGKSE